MGRKSSAKENRPADPTAPTPSGRKGFLPALLGVASVALIGFAIFTMFSGGPSVDPTVAAAATPPAPAQDGTRKAPPEADVAKNEAAAKARAALGPHKQDN